MPDKLPSELTRWLSAERLQLENIVPLTGGCVASVSQLQLSGNNGHPVELVLKQMPAAAEGELAAEAAGLQALDLSKIDPVALRIPEVLLVGKEFLLMEYLPAAVRSSDFDQQLGRGLALQHRQTFPEFGFVCDTYCGGTKQVNRAEPDGYRFFAQQRLISLADSCFHARRLTQREREGVVQVADKLPELVPPQPASLLHGDLWSGNVIAGPVGEPVLIDPAAYYGWPEAELAMTKMFGGFNDAFYRAYEELAAPDAGWESRADIYNLYHYLNHLLLFGGGYHSDVVRIVKYYSG